ncbi:MAG: hypothetical protein KDC02_12175 [Flavobacteriales bacterium]|nr:hypothetical protein [Flavobacteriales bacterium]
MTHPETTTWRFILRPLDRVQFGEERDRDQQDYLVRSRPWPQQTALLGLLRYELLRRNGLLLDPGSYWEAGVKANVVDPLIGPGSFTGQESESFGAIREVGPLAVLLEADEVLLYPCIDPGEGTAKPSTTKALASHGGKVQDASHFPGFDAKLHEAGRLVLSSLDGRHRMPLFDDGDQGHAVAHGRNRMAPEGGLLICFTVPGVTKDRDGIQSDAEREGHFYVTESHRMRSGYAYTFTATLAGHPLKEGPGWKEPQVVRFGSDGHPWLLVGKPLDNAARDPGEDPNLLLLSDARVDAKVLDLCQAVVGDVTHFRNQRKRTEHRFRHHATHSVLNDREEATFGLHGALLLQRGTVLWPREGRSDDVRELLDERQAWRTIGCNHYRCFRELTDLTPNTTNRP